MSDYCMNCGAHQLQTCHCTNEEYEGRAIKVERVPVKTIDKQAKTIEELFNDLNAIRSLAYQWKSKHDELEQLLNRRIVFQRLNTFKNALIKLRDSNGWKDVKEVENFITETLEQTK